MINLPIRLRLTLQYITLFASAAALLCLASFWMLQRSLDATEYHDLEERAEDVQLILNHDDPARSLEQLRADFAAFYRFKDDGKYLQVRDQSGNWLFRSRRMVARDPSFPPSIEFHPMASWTSFRLTTTTSASCPMRSRCEVRATRCRPGWHWSDRRPYFPVIAATCSCWRQR